MRLSGRGCLHFDMKARTAVVYVVNAGLVILAGGGCANHTQTGAGVGAASGVAIGAGVGSLVHSSAGAGALIGAGVGAISGALIGNQIDEQDRRQERELRSRPPTTGYVASSRVTQDDVIEWTQRGVKDEIIIDRIERSGTQFHLRAADENHLRENRVSEDVVRAMKQTALR